MRSYIVIFVVFILGSYIQPAHAARIVNADETPQSFKVKTGDETKTITLQPGQSYFTGPDNATVTTQDGKSLDLKGNQKSVVKGGKPLLWRGKKTPGNNQPAGYDK